MRRVWFASVLALVGVWSLLVGTAGSAEKSVAEEILDILRANDQITEQQYETLLVKARSEKESLPAVAAEAKPEDFRVYWKKGLRFDSADKRFKLQIGGRIMNDWAWVSEDNDIETTIGRQANNTEFRRARLFVAGTIYENVKFKAQYDFAGGDADFKDVYVELVKLPWVGNLKVGHFKEPFSLEELTSSKYMTFMERSLPNVFAPSRNTGIMLHNHGLDQRMTWAVGAFRDSGSFGDSGDDEGSDDTYNVTARLTGLPWYEDEGAKLLHVGLSASHRFMEDDSLRFRQRPEAHLLDYFVDTREPLGASAPAAFVDIISDGVDILNPELALLYGPFSLQGEYTRTFVEGSSFDFDSFYVQASYFLTGEHRNYKMSSGAFSRMSPRRNFDGKGGPGAWEVAVRYARLDLDDSTVTGGTLDDFTVGLNWHLNPNVRMMLNYVRANLDGVGDSNIFQSRFQIDF